MMRTLLLALTMLTLVASDAETRKLIGPGRFCGYSPIIDLLSGETVTALGGGIHAGRFRWDGAFGSLEVKGIGWAARPSGQMVVAPTRSKPGKFRQRREKGVYKLAIWNGSHGAAYFTSNKPFTAQQLAAIDRVLLFEEGETPTGCRLNSVFGRDF